MACHDEVLGERVVRVGIQVVVEERGLRGSRVHIVLELHAGMVQTYVMESAQNQKQLIAAPTKCFRHNLANY